VPSPETPKRTPSSVDQAPAPPLAADEQEPARPAKPPLEASQEENKTTSTLPAIPTDTPKAVTAPDEIEKRSPPITTPAPLPEAQPLPQAQAQQTRVIAPEATITASEDPQPIQPESTAVTGQPTTEPEEDIEKTFRNDPRIDLQALVWAPDAAARFVIINNRLIKEGGSVDNIVVVEINRDDVQLADGSDRWYEEFKIR
jgi:hypothetical protein